ncbi:HAD family hydrolase [Corynebacterium uberis]|uniref:HAD family hydrolase n=1 Tax=Corynebacterium TaxID=1716 RepID=UPI001D0B897D|nr:MULTISPECIES: HAD-IB family hydrolase [Corynebacterium]MCZ9309523.1 HAD-IB family hydrolase [Corynebacterium sp. c6VSa_13]UDL73069.1 HAD-IB family hydrolase [Corynebacterium uberis]UDL76054.1 HAD-IB family hydrolase [Corynebacterium uberis]UDL78266.1 HAD-IB family hydrolase [Corynebacterium uberis]UDL80549.1 HAD-IB family hydrolase [Corynebacterium uberis]
MNSVEPPLFPSSPREFLASWSTSHGNLRNFLETTALPPLDDAAQLAAGQAAAAAAVRDTFDLDLDSFSSGVDSVSGSIQAAGALRLSPTDPDVPQEPGVAAFFDVDNTLIQGSSLVALALGLARKRYFKIHEILPIVWKQIKYRVTGSENAEDVAEGRAQALEFVRGYDVAELARICDDIVINRVEDRAFPGTRSLAEMHLAAGHQVWLVSATPVQLAQVIARRFGFTGALGTVPEVKDGKFTGRLVGDILHGPGKSHAVAALAAIEKLDLSRCTAYSDSANDIPMLSMVGTAVAINPDRKLRAEAQRRGWQIRDYRNVRKAIRTFGLPGLVTAAFSLAGWRWRRYLHRA